MARYRAYRNPIKSEWTLTPFLLDVQNDLISAIETRVVVPSRSLEYFSKPLELLNPVFEVKGRPVVMDTAALAAIPRAALKGEAADSHEHVFEIHNAIDFLFHGF